MQLKRVKGGAVENLELAGRGIETHLDRVFTVPAGLEVAAVALVNDLTGRFELVEEASEAAATAPMDEPDAGSAGEP